MPKIEVHQKELFARLGRSYSDEELETILPSAKAELDEPVNSEGIVKIELNDTNRPDLWSTSGLARLLSLHRGDSRPDYDFFSNREQAKDSSSRLVKVDASVQNVRPFVVAFVAGGRTVDQPSLDDIIQTQEKLCWNFGQKRKAIAMGVYRSELIEYPVHYKAVDPATTRFTPLGMDREMNLLEINAEHPKGQEYGHIVAASDRFPFLTDNRGEVLSYPPVINSARIGAVEAGDSELFVEMTGGDLRQLMLAASIVACDMADSGFTIRPVTIEYPFDTDFGRKITTPYYFQEPQSAGIAYINKLLGVRLDAAEIKTALERMGNRVELSGDELVVYPPEYRNDFLHSVDIVEDVMIGRGMDSFIPELPGDFTVGRLTDAEQFMRRVRNTLVGLGFQEMIFNYLGSARDYIHRMHPGYLSLLEDLTEGSSISEQIKDDSIVQIMNPMSENYEFVRNSILPGLLNAESVSGNASYPHYIYEVGKTARLDAQENYGTRTINTLGMIVADNDAGFNLISSQISTMLYYLRKEFRVVEADDQRFIPGRCARLLSGDREIGVFGELHPGILENWGIAVPVSACEIDLDALRG